MRIKALITSLFTIATAAYASAYSLWPVPQSMSYSNDIFPISDHITIVADNDVNQLTISRAKEVLDNAGIQSTISTTPNPEGQNMFIGVNGTKGHATQYATTHSLSLDVFNNQNHCFDPHIVYVDNSNILVIGNNEGSAFYGMASLEQMFEQSVDGSLPGVLINDYAHTKYRGLVEGFYGHPWSIESRLNLFDYMKRYKMNYYVYGPKADPYHAGNWRINYPETVTEEQRLLGQITTEDMHNLATHAAQCNVDFVWAIHPTLGSYSIDLNWVSDIMSKFEQLYSLGVRHFGVSVDDMRGHPTNQAQLPHLVQQAIDEKWNTDNANPADRVGNVLFVPTCYAINYGASYSLTPIKEISPKVEVAFTGYDCFSNLRASSFSQMASYIDRDPIFWWNNPVNDDHDAWLYMHGLTERWIIEQKEPVENMRGFLLNPMNQGQASKVCIFSGADYCWNPSAFNEQLSWEQSLRSIVKTDENVAALKKFLRVLSAYTTVETTSPEGEELKEVYQAFQNSYSTSNIPESSELLQAMQDCYDACTLMRTFKDNEDPDLALFYIDIEPWLNKLSDMCYIVIHTLEYMNGEASLDNWANFSDLVEMANNIHTNHLMSVLEGSGTSTYEVFQEVHPTPKYFDPFIDFLAGVLPDYAPTLPARDKSPKIITNLQSTPNVTLQDNDNSHSLSGLSNISLNLGEYIGVCLNSIESVTLQPAALPDGVVLEHSISGKEWTLWEGEETDMAYFRLRGNSESEVTLNFNTLPYSKPVIPVDSKPTATTNMGTYQSYVISNIVDGQSSTFFWSNDSQHEGDYITLDFGASNPRRNITLLFNKGDHPTGTALIQLSNDASQWSTIASFTDSDIIDNTFTCSANDTPARYVRLYIQSVSNTNWFQLAEFTVTSLASQSIATTYDAEGNAITTLNDISLTSYHAASGEGFIEHSFIENLDIREIHIYHNSKFANPAELPTIEVYSNGEWHSAGVLNDQRTIVNVPEELRHVTRMRISWTEGNAPQIHEIYPEGPEYVQPASDYAGIESVNTDSEHQLTFSLSARTLTIKAKSTINSVEITDASGRVITSAHPATTTVTLPVNTPVFIATVHLSNGTTVSRKLSM